MGNNWIRISQEVSDDHVNNSTHYTDVMNLPGGALVRETYNWRNGCSVSTYFVPWISANLDGSVLDHTTGTAVPWVFGVATPAPVPST